MKKTAFALFAALMFAILFSGCGTNNGDVSLIYAAPPSSSPLTDASSSQATDGGVLSPHGNVQLPPTDGDIIEITERLFVAQTNDIYLNGEDYIGKTLKYEGIYKNSLEWDPESDDIIHFVIRYGPGCCGYDGEAGFEVRWSGEYPNPDDWVEVVGVLREIAYETGYKVLYLDVSSITVKEERGAERVVM